MNRLIITISSIFIFSTSFAQLSNERCRWITSFDKPLFLDSLSINAESITLDGVAFTGYNYTTGQITVPQQSGKDSVQVCYQVFPLAFHQSTFNRSLSVYDSNAYFKDPVKPRMLLRQEELFKTDGLYKSGTLARGITFGNNQDVFVNSTLNLSLDGQLAENLYLRASITDQNVPYQPEGNTQQLQDFDNVFIELYNDNFSLIGGDVVFQNSPSHFLRYYKNVQGGLATVKYDIAGHKAETMIGLSVAKGKFASDQLEPIEGLSGPYRIPGPDNQRFLLILANSERVFLDGNQLKRGFDEDYIIDYNSGEITFTNKVLITQFTRLRVDYEYSDQNYSRTITTAGHRQNIGNLDLSINYYSERDNPNRPLLYELEDQEKQLLSDIGDELEQATVATYDSIGFSSEAILYKKISPNGGDNAQEIFVYSTNPDSAVYNVSFSEVGLGNGNYVQVNSTANGRVFQWVAPENGSMRGNYEPVTVLPAPNKRQMLSVNANYEINDYEVIYSEVAMSNHDLNLFSDIDDENNQAFAVKSGIKTAGRKIRFLPDYELYAYVDYEYDEEFFNPIDRFRYIEFDRDWNYDPNADNRQFADQIINGGVAVKRNGDHISYDITNRQRGTQVDGFQHRVTLNQSLKNVKIRSNWFKMNNDQDSLNADWERLITDVSYQSKFIIPGYSYHFDHNVVRSANNDSVQFSSMYFDEHTFYITSQDTASFQFDLRHSIREDQAPTNGEITDFTTSQTTRLSLSKAFKSHSIEGIFNYRQLNVIDSDTEETISGRFDWSGRWLNNHMRSELTYAVANSQELRREFVFVKVPPSQGTHTWRDLNEDGVQDIGEFFEAINPDERNYAKIFTPANDFIQAFQNLFILRLNVDAPRSWKNSSGIKKVLSKFSNNTSWSADTKTTDQDLETRLLAFAQNELGTDLLAERNALRSTMFFNRANPDYGIDVTYTNNGHKQLLVNGFESRSLEEYQTNVRVNFSKQYNLSVRYSTSNKDVSSDFIDDRNYLISAQRINPRLSWQPSDNMRFTLQYATTVKDNILEVENQESVRLNEWIGELKLNKAIKSTFNAQFRYVNIDFEGVENSQVGYDMLEALRPGTNLTWMVNWQQKVTKGLQLNLSYNGRKSENNDAIHIGRVQVSALF